MTYKEETYVLDTLKELQEKIRDMPIEQLIRETHENNIMLRQIIKVINTWIKHHPQENANAINGNLSHQCKDQFENLDTVGVFRDGLLLARDKYELKIFG